MHFAIVCTIECMNMILDSYWIKRGLGCVNISDPLFVGLDGRNLAKEDIEAIFKRISHESGINIRPSDLRIF